MYLKKATIMLVAGVVQILAVCHAAALNPNGFLDRYQKASNQERALLCNSAMFTKAADVSNAATLHGGLDKSQSEAIWAQIEQLRTKTFVFDQIARSMSPEGYETASKAVMDAFVAVHLENDQLARAEEAQLADFCGRRMYEALRVTDPRDMDRLEAVYKRVASESGNEEGKADFLKRAIQPYHDD